MGPTGCEHPDDALLIDYLLGHCSPAEAEQVRQRLASDEQFCQRSKKARSILGALDFYDVEDPPQALVERTLAAVRSARKTSALLDLEVLRGRPVAAPTFSLKELGALAAMLFLVATVLIPSFRNAQSLSRQQACLSKAGQIGTALRQYAAENGGALPSLGLSEAGWLTEANVPQRVSNSQNLWRLARGSFAEVRLFQCPAAGSAREFSVSAEMVDFPGPQYISYSYHNSVNGPTLTLTACAPTASTMVILADQTPLFDSRAFQPDKLDKQFSPNHGRSGQTVLYLDGRAAWVNRPDVGVNGDNIWMVRGVTTYRGVEKPADLTDTFLLPSYINAGR